MSMVGESMKSMNWENDDCDHFKVEKSKCRVTLTHFQLI